FAAYSRSVFCFPASLSRCFSTSPAQGRVRRLVPQPARSLASSCWTRAKKCCWRGPCVAPLEVSPGRQKVDECPPARDYATLRIARALVEQPRIRRFYARALRSVGGSLRGSATSHSRADPAVPS